MSVDNFVQKCEERLTELRAQISDVIKKDNGRKVFSHMRSQMQEVDKLNQAIYKATRRGLRE